ncbi:MAG: hypothetical protein Q4F05_11255 [bacterium]|nr:hypothetical protein [bacterium]
MAYQGYVEFTEYKAEYDSIPDDVLERRLKEASRNIDLLTYNRIVAQGFDNLTEYQQEIIKECTIELADFYYTNDDMIQNVLQNYSINGVSMSFGATWNVAIRNGVAISQATYSKLMSTGLCNTTLRR